ncbi:hypothetical protein RM553_00295 [Zunongwangia sp. F363]|uniref:Uncharacterized protein n=1 Tax=Autumnicola tepida TaxID=3075595 RepID=A0ABU3C4L1_9FLAO|nr:hypothetical protein [Zunongwangia sp. F363]MDT0641256.1 hypothetical protein [Zunongwangia sp. F363]
MAVLFNQLLLPLQKKEAMFCFFIAKKSRINNRHVIHTHFCELLPEENGRLELGYFDDIESAITAGKKRFSRVEVCKYCCNF